MSTRRRIGKLLAVCSIAGVTLLSGCSSINISDEAKEQGITTICDGSQMAIKQLDTGDNTAKFAATLIRDNTDNAEIKKVASKVADGDGTKAERAKLIEYIKDECDS